jgi:hypothetical protein
MDNGITSSAAALIAGSYRQLMGRAAKVGGPAGGLIGMCADLGAPVASLAMYFTVGAAALTVMAGWMWFGRRQRQLRVAMADGRITGEEMAEITQSNAWSVTFAFGLVTTLILGIVFLAQSLMPKKDDGPDRGVLATIITPLQKVQDSLFNLQKDVTEIKAVTGETKAQTERIEAKQDQVLTKLEDMSRAFEAAAQSGTFIENAQTPAEHYHNARFAELKANARQARESYAAFVTSGAEFIDPCIAWTDMLKIHDGIEGARETAAAMRKNNTTLSLEAAAALLLPQAARTGALQQLAERAPEFAPVFYLLSREFSVEKKGEQTVADKKEEKATLEKFMALHDKGQFLKFIMDKKEGQKWIEDASARLAKVAATPDAVLKTPVTLSPQQSNDGWMLTFGFADFKLKKIEYRLDGQGEFKDTGLGTVANPQTGLPMPNPFFSAGTLSEGEHSVEVRYTDMSDKVNGPYKLTFNTGTAALNSAKQVLNQLAPNWLLFREYDGKLLLYFTSLLSYRGSLKSIRYSLDGDSLDKTFPFEKPASGEGPYETGKGPIFIEVPANTKSACVQIEYADGTLSEKKTFPRP